MTKIKLPTGTLIALATTGLFFVILTSSTLISGIEISPSINSGGTITSMNVEIFNNNEGTQKCTNINWGTLTPGESINQTIYIKNTGNKQITLHMAVEKWYPINATNFMSLSWDKENTSLNPDQIISANLTLSVAANINLIDDFNFNIIITGIEYT